MSHKPLPFEQWPAESHRRWVQAGNTFGLHLMKAARDYAFERIPDTASPEVRELVPDGEGLCMGFHGWI